jgi:putative secretion ATPase (PEP-CTERM system associated)
MYESFYRFTMKPFELLPNPNFLYPSKSHRKVVTYLDYALRESAGFILLTGETGSGKTTLIRDLIRKHHEALVISKITHTLLNADQLIAMINEDFGLEVMGKDKTTLLRELNQFLIAQYCKGKRPLLLIDEAQNLTPSCLEEIRLLSNLETDRDKLLHVILVGQPELRTTLNLPELLQLRQRINFFCHILPLEKGEIGPYILHRMECAGNRDALQFPEETLEIIWRYSRGVPRLINIICEFLILAAFVDEAEEITPELANEVVSDLDFEVHFWREREPVPATPVPAEPQLRDAGHAEGELRSLLTQILHRIDGIERKEVKPHQGHTGEVLSRLEKHEESLRGYIEATARKFDAITRELQATKTAPAPSPPPVEGNVGKRGGLFGNLFRRG